LSCGKEIADGKMAGEKEIASEKVSW